MSAIQDLNDLFCACGYFLTSNGQIDVFLVASLLVKDDQTYSIAGNPHHVWCMLLKPQKFLFGVSFVPCQVGFALIKET